MLAHLSGKQYNPNFAKRKRLGLQLNRLIVSEIGKMEKLCGEIMVQNSANDLLYGKGPKLDGINFVAPKSSLIGKVLDWYNSLNVRDRPALAIAVPARHDTNWRSKLKGFTLVKEYMAGSKIFQGNGHRM